MNFKEWGLAIGLVLLFFGLMCFPVGMGISPKRDLSLFNNLADLGVFWKIGIVFVVIGTLVLLTSQRKHRPKRK